MGECPGPPSRAESGPRRAWDRAVGVGATGGVLGAWPAAPLVQETEAGAWARIARTKTGGRSRKREIGKETREELMIHLDAGTGRGRQSQSPSNTPCVANAAHEQGLAVAGHSVWAQGQRCLRPSRRLHCDDKKAPCLPTAL